MLDRTPPPAPDIEGWSLGKITADLTGGDYSFAEYWLQVGNSSPTLKSSGLFGDATMPGRAVNSATLAVGDWVLFRSAAEASRWELMPIAGTSAAAKFQMWFSAITPATASTTSYTNFITTSDPSTFNPEVMNVEIGGTFSGNSSGVYTLRATFRGAVVSTIPVSVTPLANGSWKYRVLLTQYASGWILYAEFEIFNLPNPTNTQRIVDRSNLSGGSGEVLVIDAKTSGSPNQLILDTGYGHLSKT
jgi:hypothetical protein